MVSLREVKSRTELDRIAAGRFGSGPRHRDVPLIMTLVLLSGRFIPPMAS